MPEHIIDLLSGGRDREYRKSKVTGVIVGIVTNIADPEGMGRVKVRYPTLMDKEEDESYWARLASPFMAGKGRGSWFIPEVDDEVLVAFENGDIEYPYVVGMLWNGKDVPPVLSDVTGSMSTPTGYSPNKPAATEGDNEKNDTRFIRSRSGHLIILDDKKDEEQIALVDKDGKNHVRISSKSIAGSGSQKAGQSKGTIVLTSEEGDIELHAPKGTIYMESKYIETKTTKHTKMEAADVFETLAKKDMSHETKKNLNVKAGMNAKYESGTNTEIKASANAKFQAGAQMEIKASAMMTIKTSAIMTVKGSLVKIN